MEVYNQHSEDKKPFFIGAVLASIIIAILLSIVMATFIYIGMIKGQEERQNYIEQHHSEIK